MEGDIPSLGRFIEAFLSWQWQTQVGFVAFFLIWIGGGNIVFRRSQKRSKVELPETLNFKALSADTGMNRLDVFYLVLCGIVGTCFFAWGFSYQ